MCEDVKEIQSIVAQFYGLKRDYFLGSSRKALVVRPRQVAMYLARKYSPKTSYPRLGELFGGKDHTTIMHGCRRIERLVTSDYEIRADVEWLTETIDAALRERRERRRAAVVHLLKTDPAYARDYRKFNIRPRVRARRLEVADG